MDGNLSDLLQKTISSDELDLIHRVADEASGLGFSIYIVGGFVRDLILGHSTLDFDLVVEGDAIKLADSLASKYGGKTTVHQKFRTAKWFVNKHSFVDLISARSEIYEFSAALPTVKMGTISDDLHRRDFTINTLAIRLDGNHFGELHDKLGGLHDLQHGLVRVLHPRSFADDPTRMFRAVRYEKRYDFNIAQETSALIPEARQLIEKLTAQRIRHELDLILDETNAASMLARLDKLGLLKPIHPSLRCDKALQTRFESATDFPLGFSSSGLSNIRDLRWLLWLMTLPNKEITSLNKRLHFTTPLLKSLLASSKLWADLTAFSSFKPSQCVERLGKFPLQAVYAVLRAAPRGKSKQALEKYLMEWRHIQPRTTGNDLKRLGLEPGPKYQTILQKLRNAWLDGEVKNIKDEKFLLEKILG
ncbi:MAG: CCA tRNA nucleotidyltransferase [Anaerolineales bacterium]